MIRKIGTLVVLMLVTLLGAMSVGVVLAAALPAVQMQPGDTLTINCPTRIIQHTNTGTQRTFTCKAAPTPKPTPTPRPTPTPTPVQTPFTPPTGGDNVLIGAGDIAVCGRPNDEATAALLDTHAGTIFIAGDSAYSDGAPADYDACFEPSWGRHKTRIRPAPGNHEYHTPGAAGYFGYFGPAAGPSGEGYYAYDIGTWRVYSLNSEVISTAQVDWLLADLAANPSDCIAAYWHHPRFSSEYEGGLRGDDDDVEPLWDALADAGAELVLNGHMHRYERMSPIRGVTEVIVGTGGANLRGFGAISPTSVVRNATDHGVLEVTLDGSEWSAEFIPIAGKTFTDSFSGSCSPTP